MNITAIWITGGIIVLLALWAFASLWFIKDIETPEYTVMRVDDGYELREYPPYIVAEVTVPAEGFRDGVNSGFMVVADYIFGNNVGDTEIAMTAPVISGTGNRDGQKIAMTAPVLSGNINGDRTVAFVMPREYTLETLPTPRDARVQLREVPGRIVAVKRFSWWATDTRVATKQQSLLRALAHDDVITNGEPYYAGYNPPLSAPFVQRHEVMVDIAL